MTPEEFIKEYTRSCSNALLWYNNMQNPVIEYYSWLTPEQALRAVELAREEIIDKAYKLKKNITSLIVKKWNGWIILNIE